MSTEMIAIAVGVIITWLLVTWVFKVVKASVSTAFTIAIILIVLQIFFGINSQQILQELQQIFQQFLYQ